MGFKPRGFYTDAPDKIIINSDLPIFNSDYLYLKFTAKKYSIFRVKIYFGSYNSKDPLGALKAKLSEVQKQQKFTRNRQNKDKFNEKVILH